MKFYGNLLKVNFLSLFSNQDIRIGQNGIRLEPLTYFHTKGLQAVSQEGDLWKLRVTVIPHSSKVKNYINEALEAKERQERYPFAVIDENTGKVLGTTSFFEIAPDVRRLEIGYTWYAKSFQRTHVNTNCIYLLLEYAFENCKSIPSFYELIFLISKVKEQLNDLVQKKMEFYVVIFLDRMVLCAIPLFTP